MADLRKAFLPAAGRDWALPLYDPLIKVLGAEAAKRTLLDQANLQDAHRVLDVGCGTGTLAILIKRRYRNIEVLGLDPDPKALARARAKAARAVVSIRLDRGFADELPYPDASFDRVFSSFMFHHLEAGQREKALREARRVLAPEGSLHLLDFTRPEDRDAWRARMFESNPRMKDNSDSRILALMRCAGFARSKKVMERAIFFGLLHIAYYQAIQSGSQGLAVEIAGQNCSSALGP